MQAQGIWSAGEGDGKKRFLADLRALRDSAALEFDELAARAHYPSDVLKEAENGPSLPSLPILAAYIRACDGDVLEWEERWRRLSADSRADPSLPVRAAGASPAAVAGARAGVSVAPPDAYDPERIRAALRGSQGRSDGGRSARRRIGRETPALAEPVVPESPASWSGATSWDETRRWDAGDEPGTGAGWDAVAQPGAGWAADAQPSAGWGVDTQQSTSWDGFTADAGARWDDAAADLSGTPANGNHHPNPPTDGVPDTVVMGTPDAAHAEAIRRDPFSADWLQDGELTSPPELEPEREPGWPGGAEAGPTTVSPASWFSPSESVDHDRSRPTADTEPLAAADAWFAPRERTDSGLASPEHDPTPLAESGLAPSQDYAGSAEPRVSGFWTSSAGASAAGSPERATPIVAATVAAAAAAAASSASDSDSDSDSGSIAAPAVPPGPVAPPSERRPDRLYPVRLLVVIVVAALIGSILVLLLR